MMMNGTDPAPPDVERFAALADRILAGSRLVSAWPLLGGVSAQVHALLLETADGSRRTVVLRQLSHVEWKSRESDAATMEHDLLAALFARGLPVPQPLLVDASLTLLPVPYFVMSFVPGTAEVPARRLDDALETMARIVARLHGVATEGLPHLPSRLDPLPELYDYLPMDPEGNRLRVLLEDLGMTAFIGEPVLLHGDFWPGNLLWQDGELRAILDWEDAALGDPAADLAGCRLELTWKFGAEAATRFTAAYKRLRPVYSLRLALWEIYVASAALHFMSAWGLPPEREALMRREAKIFVQEAARRLGEDSQGGR